MNYIDDNIKFIIDNDLILSKIQTTKGSKISKKVEKLTPIMQSICIPKYIFKEVKIEKLTDTSFFIEGKEFKSKICVDKLKDKTTMYAYIVTCGEEIARLQEESKSVTERLIIEKTCNLACYCSRDALKKVLKEQVNAPILTSLNPGSIIDWSVSDVKNIFKLFGDDYKKIGVEVIDSGMIHPLASVSGFFIQTNEEFHSCELCKKEDCPNRKAPFDEGKYLDAMKL